MKSTLDKIESQLESFIESSVQIIPWGNQNLPLAHQLIEAMQNGLRNNEDGEVFAPDLYTIFLNPQTLPHWQRNEVIITSLAETLHDAASQSNILFDHPPILRLAVDPSLDINDVRVSAENYIVSIEDTSALPVDDNPLQGESTLPKNAYLIVDGTSVFHLSQPVINIGRRIDNHLVIDDPRVSRTHVQLRAIKNQYILFDLNATGGTFVNGQRIARQILKAGDVISLAGLSLIYGQDLPPAPKNSNEITGSTTTIVP
jgi:hypothetical protein